MGPDGFYDLELNRFGRELDGWGVRSMHTVNAYMRDLALYCRYLHVCRSGRTIWESGQADLRGYKRARRRTDGPERVSGATWNRFLAALDKWARWAVSEGLLPAVPFRMVERTVRTPAGVATVLVNIEREPDEEDQRIRVMPYEEYLLWRDVGLRGQLPGGGPDPHWRGRHGERNAVFADVLIGTGMRLTEAASLPVTELPTIGAPQAASPLHLPATITKRNRARTVFVPARVMKRLHQYVLKRTTKDANHDTAKRTRELEDTIRVYANHIQVLTLRNHRLEEEIQRLQEQLTRSDPSLRVLRLR
ncbi:hypothetical protein GCM10010435_74990 [Winogradskya consettensis]|uniref:Core-binding (CB) domain-containing protein n=1 Tax=Winogradskya consettensis TaxID=113560 RepID=A0A919VXS9_9ACTN|nr:hypothetical protein Aco04nite_74770 [Actinoplanes consettensis]